MHNLIDKYIFNPELLTYLHIKNNNINLYPISWNFKINWHDNALLNEWWRIEPHLNITPKIFNQFINLKTTSYQIIELKFLNNPDTKYTFTHATTNQHLYVPNINDINGITLSCDKSNKSQFYITIPPQNILYRINIVLNKSFDNLNHDGTGWNMFTIPDDCRIFGCGNSGYWAQFYIEQEDDYYYISSFHSVNIENKSKTFGRYIGIEQDCLVSDLPKCPNAKWIITPQ